MLAGIILGWLERAWHHGTPVCIGIGASNYNAIDNVLTEVAEVLEHRYRRVGLPPLATHLLRVRSASASPPLDTRIQSGIDQRKCRRNQPRPENRGY